MQRHLSNLLDDIGRACESRLGVRSLTGWCIIVVQGGRVVHCHQRQLHAVGDTQEIDSHVRLGVSAH
jgi:hypothetical protein